MSSVMITIKSEATKTHLDQEIKLPSGKPKEEAQALKTLISKIASGVHPAVVDVQTSATSPVAASGTFTLVSAIATDAITIGTVTMTATSTPSLATDFEIDGASDALDATSLAAAINANPTLGAVVTASALSNVVTVTAKVKGVVGNQIPISSADATITASGAFLTGGTGGADEAATSYSLGIS